MKTTTVTIQFILTEMSDSTIKSSIKERLSEFENQKKIAQENKDKIWKGLVEMGRKIKDQFNKDIGEDVWKFTDRGEGGPKMSSIIYFEDKVYRNESEPYYRLKISSKRIKTVEFGNDSYDIYSPDVTLTLHIDYRGSEKSYNISFDNLNKVHDILDNAYIKYFQRK